MRKFLGTHLGHSGICTMCSLLSNRWITCTCGCGHHIPSYRTNESDPMLLRGAVFYIAMSLWGPFKVKSLKHSFGSVLPSLKQVSNYVCVCVCAHAYMCAFLMCLCLCCTYLSAYVHVCLFVCVHPGHPVRTYHSSVRGIIVHCSAGAQVWSYHFTN